MLNLHPPFRRATADDLDTVRILLGERSREVPAEAVVAVEDGSVVAVMDGRPDGETWRVEALAVAATRADELTPRILAIADALAAEEGLASVSLDPAALDPAVRSLLDQEGFRPVEGGLMVRPVVAQG